MEATDWSWQPVFMDVDLDGYEDLLVTNGRSTMSAGRDAVARSPVFPRPNASRLARYLPPFVTANVAYRNQGNFRFTVRGRLGGLIRSVMSHGIATGDLDNDVT